MPSVSRSTPRTDLPPLLTTGRATVLGVVTCLLVPLFLGVDRWIARAMTGLDPGVIGFFQAITFLGRSPGYLVGAAAVAVWCLLRARMPDRAPEQRSLALARAEAAAFVFTTVAAAGIATNIVKVLAGRLRPSMLLEAGQYGFAPFSFESTMRSFPSGHATTIVALALALGALWPCWRRWLLAAACVIAASRVAINAHYLGDVVGGALVAVLTMLATRRAFASRGWAFRVERGRYARRRGPEP
jgi:membrane-associated phospholipid phosphatase